MALYIPDTDLARLVTVVFPVERDVAMALALCESGGDTESRYVTAIEDSRGLWQINILAHPQFASWNLYYPPANAVAAREVWWNSNGWSPWACYDIHCHPSNERCYKYYLPRAWNALREATAFKPALPVTGPLTSPFTPSHPAIDIAVPHNTPVKACASGTVAKIYHDSLVQMPPELGYGGFMIEIDHDDGFMTRYLHLVPYSNQVQVGNRVSCGQVIGYADTTGSATGPHLHFAVWNKQLVFSGGIYIPSRDYYAFNPWLFLRQTCPVIPPVPPPPPPPPSPPWPSTPPWPPYQQPTGLYALGMITCLSLGAIGIIALTSKRKLVFKYGTKR